MRKSRTSIKSPGLRTIKEHFSATFRAFSSFCRRLRARAAEINAIFKLTRAGNRVRWGRLGNTRDNNNNNNKTTRTIIYLASALVLLNYSLLFLYMARIITHPRAENKQTNKPKTTPSCQGASLWFVSAVTAAAAAAAALNQRIAPQLVPFKRLLQAIRRPNQQKRGVCVGRSRRGCFMTIINEGKITVMRGIRRPKIYN